MADTSILSWLGRASICGIAGIEHAAKVMQNYYQGVGPESEYDEQKESIGEASWLRQKNSLVSGEILSDEEVREIILEYQRHTNSRPVLCRIIEREVARRMRPALASRPAEVEDEGLPPLARHIYHWNGLELVTVEDYRQGQRDAVAADRMQREKLPANAQEMVAFIGSHYNSMRDDKPDPNDIEYELTVHDLLSAFRWWFDDFELEDEPQLAGNKDGA